MSAGASGRAPAPTTGRAPRRRRRRRRTTPPLRSGTGEPAAPDRRRAPAAPSSPAAAPSARANRRFATFAQPISSTPPTAPISASSAVSRGGRVGTGQRLDASAPAAVAGGLFRLELRRDPRELAADASAGSRRRACAPTTSNVRARRCAAGTDADRQARPRIGAFGKRKSRRHDADDFARQPSFEHDLPADDVRRSRRRRAATGLADHELPEGAGRRLPARI